ncbi:exodeoxyribonuclease VII small subunit [Streptomyces tubbatahanensis]|uniref:Exodeoxyribonuclease 7 small subunit n=1 Tax=Streptomyces tubbatahanensis TaxID=2923272 RepID=A0ABY3XW46_9ACTN|nr:exodeoxyribonuclease VII small subunit [Streptomyces tubbatahanensis]UNS98727.1 exodeoxyribonuclease VII small subunit [Streptomyces tubbatahanensis]
MTTEAEGAAAAEAAEDGASRDDASASQAELATADALSYEQARAELVEVVQRLESGGSTLEESLALWERGEELAGICRAWLDGARARLDAVLEEEEGEGEEGADEAEGDDAG